MTMFKPFICSKNEKVYEEGKSIYQNLRIKYPNKNDEDTDIILNSLCFALVCLMHNNVDEDNFPYFRQLVHKILLDNSQT